MKTGFWGRRLGWALGFGLCGVLAARAEPEPRTVDGVPGKPSHLLLVAGLRGSYPQIVEAPLGLMIGRYRSAVDLPSSIQGLLIQAVPGLGGGRLAVGYALVGGPTSKNHRVMLPILGLGVKAAYLRTWGDPWHLSPGRDYFGVEAEITYVSNVAIGVYRGADDDFLVSIGVGLGF